MYQSAQVYNDNSILFHIYKFKKFSNDFSTLKQLFLSEQGSTYFDERAPKINSCAFQSDPITNQGIPCHETCKAADPHYNRTIWNNTNITQVGLYLQIQSLKSTPKMRIQFKWQDPYIFGKCFNRGKLSVQEFVGWQYTRNRTKQKAKYENT